MSKMNPEGQNDSGTESEIIEAEDGGEIITDGGSKQLKAEAEGNSAVGTAEIFVEPEQVNIVVKDTGELVKMHVRAGRSLNVMVALDHEGAAKLGEKLKF